MLNNPALLDPRTALHTLDFKKAVVCLMALFMPDCPRPVDREWLSLRTGVKSLTTITYSMKHLVNLGVVHKTVSGWFLTDGARQLPLPFNQLESSAKSASVTIIDAEPSSQSGTARPGSQLAGYPQSAQSVDNPTSQPSSSGKARPGTQPAGRGSVQNERPAQTAVQNERPSQVVSSFCTAEQQDVVVVNSYTTQPSQQQAKQQDTQTPFKMNATGRFLTKIGMLHGVPERYAHYDLTVALAYWWEINTWADKNPQGSLFRRLSQGHTTPPAAFLELARAWLAMDPDDREYLRDTAGGNQRGPHSPLIERGNLLRHQLDEDFYPDLSPAALDAYLQLCKKGVNLTDGLA